MKTNLNARRATRLFGHAALIIHACAISAAADWVTADATPGAFPLVQRGQAAALVYSPEDHRVAALAVADLAADVARVTGATPLIFTNASDAKGPVVLVGTLGRSPLVDQLAAGRKIDAGGLAGQWESFVIATVSNALPGVLTLTAYLLPARPLSGRALRFALGLNDEPPNMVSLDIGDDRGSAWAQGVLNAAITATAAVTIPTAGWHTLRLSATDSGVALDRLVLSRDGPPPGYLGGRETVADE